MSNHQILELSRRGLIPGPDEGEENFSARVNSAPPVTADLSAFERTKLLYDVAPDWVEICTGDGLLPWHGGVMESDGAHVTLRVRRGGRFYQSDELISHELVHAGRVAFDEPIFEEFFAYRTSKSWFRRWLGPVIQRPWEVWILFVAMFVGAWVPLIPLSVVGLGLGRLGWRHWTLRRCVRTLESRWVGKGWGIAYRLTDREIRDAARGNLTADRSLRWKFIQAYRAD